MNRRGGPFVAENSRTGPSPLLNERVNVELPHIVKVAWTSPESHPRHNKWYSAMLVVSVILIASDRGLAYLSELAI